MKDKTRWHWKALAIVAGTVAVAVQFVPYGHERTNPPTIAEPRWDSAETRELARRACFDCHSNQTSWPVYSRVAPASWLVYYDVVNGRAELNFSEWQRPQKEAGESPAVVREGEMPPLAYRLMHGHARLSPDERARLARGLANTVRGEHDAARAPAVEDSATLLTRGASAHQPSSSPPSNQSHRK